MHLLIPAAGSGSRMGSNRNKLLLPLLERNVLAWTLQAADKAESIVWIGIIGQPVDRQAVADSLERDPVATPVQWIEGGSTRQESVSRGLLSLPPTASHVLIHDGARCLATPDLLDRSSAALTGDSAIIAAVPVKDTIKEVDPETYRVQTTPQRERLWAAQTPQGFDVGLLKAAHALAREQAIQVTDDAALFELLGYPVEVIPGEETNIKVTTPFDLWLAEAILRSRTGL